jgi:uncharacterized protein YabN with tetrapyrrole methylase and pyrophosphatase domain
MAPLRIAHELQARAARVGFDWPDAQGPLLKVKEEVGELEREILKDSLTVARIGKRESIEEEIGDLLFAVVNLARKLGIDSSQALEQANAKFQRRFNALKRLAAKRGIAVGRASLESLDELWEEVKAVEGGRRR